MGHSPAAGELKRIGQKGYTLALPDVTISAVALPMADSRDGHRKLPVARVATSSASDTAK